MKQVVFRQILSSLFVMLAFSVLTAHEVIPHHHHDNHICLEHKNNHSDHSHETEDPEHQGESCALQNVSLVTSNNHSQEISALFLLNDARTDHDHHAQLNEWFGNILLLTPLPFRQTPFTNLRTSLFTGYVGGLRAPPVA